MECPEPLDRVLEAVDRLEAGCCLRMLHWREPVMLFPILEKRGFACRTCREEKGDYEFLIWRAGDARAEAAARASFITRP